MIFGGTLKKINDKEAWERFAGRVAFSLTHVPRFYQSGQSSL